jgi:hypothetical protein
MVAVKNSTKRQAVRSPAPSIRAGRPPGKVITAGVCGVSAVAIKSVNPSPRIGVA